MFINSASGKRFQVDVTADDTVRTLKNRITDEVGVTHTHMKLNFRGTALKDNDATLASYGVDPSNAEVELGLTLHGGCGLGCDICGVGGGCRCTIL